MEQKTIEKFRVIGACVKMQTTSLEDEIKLMDGVPYDIDFFQDYSAMRVDGRPLEEIPVLDIIESILNSKSETVICAVYDDTPSWESYQRSQRLWEAVEKYTKGEIKREKKWKKGKQKRKQNAKCLWAEIDNGKFFLKDRRRSK